MNSGAVGATFVVFVILGLVGYFLPTIIGVSRSHRDLPAIAAVNILLGWTVFGWFVSFIWSLADPRGRGAAQTVVVNTTQHTVAADAVTYREPPRPPAAADDDTSFWDGLTDKGDPDQLEEYLIRFPAGRFASLARSRLARRGVPPAPALVQPSTCSTCGATLELDARFCGDCGAALGASAA